MSATNEKPPGSKWTDEQWAAISLHGRDMLVAAAAGSGKTAVLVERIIRRITDEERPLDVDRLLVATFTKAAASEMRERIREALEKELERKPASDHLRRQLALVHRASITTLHSFCMEVIQRYFQLIRLDPAFRIANETEAELMRQDVLEELFEHFYEVSGQDSAFWQLVDAFSGERSDDAIFRLVLQLYDFSRSHPSPEAWLRQAAESFENTLPEEEIAVTSLGKARGANTDAQQTDPIWLLSLLQDVQLELEGIEGLLLEALKLARQPGGPAPYISNLLEELELAGRLLQHCTQRSWSKLHEAMQSAAFGRLKPCKADETDKELQERVKLLREQAKKRLAEMKDELFSRSTEQYAAELRELAPLMGALVELTGEFGARYQAAKLDKGLLDFSDLEHYCLQILRSDGADPQELIPSAAALDYREQYEEVLLDEYQDTNRVQEAIVSLLSRPAPGNRFMVGDVKQSIYRFRLAEPGLFLEKYKAYIPNGKSMTPLLPDMSEDHRFSLDSADDAESFKRSGLRIDLARNFRSRKQIVDAVNYLFRQLMHEKAAEITYDADAELVCGANYPDVIENDVQDLSADVLFIDRSLLHGEAEEKSEDGYTEAEPTDDEPEFDSSQTDVKDLETAQMEARMIASQIHRFMGIGGEGFMVTDKRTGQPRQAAYRDMVILLRATAQWTPVIMEELRLAGIPAYADLNTGYFSAVEIEVVLSLLKVIDNPYQDIPLASVLRSPMFGFTAEEMAQIRVHSAKRTYFEALLSYAEVTDGSEAADRELQVKLQEFLRQLDAWRKEARQETLAALIWRIYRQTGYYDFVGGLPGGIQRQANLRALYDRARQYEATSFRGLFRFLRFIERMRDSGGDLGTARALGEQEDVVRIMSIHKSKGLEFPIVFVAALNKKFNQQDLHTHFLLHKELGFGPRYVDSRLRVTYPSLPALAIRRRMRMETLAEELRILYVALTRAKEKLVLIATVKSLDKELLKWSSIAEAQEWALPAFHVARAGSCLDWIGSALIRHRDALPLLESAGLNSRKGTVPQNIHNDPSRWRFTVVKQQWLAEAAAARESMERHKAEAVARGTAVLGYFERQEKISERFLWQYPFASAQELFSKTSVSEMKRMSDALQANRDDDWQLPILHEMRDSDGQETKSSRTGTDAAAGLHERHLLRRPSFKTARQLTPAERGTIYHAVMQHIPLGGTISEQTVRDTLQQMEERQMLLPRQREEVDPSVPLSFFQSELGKRVLSSSKVLREVPFSYGIPAGEIYPHADERTRTETVLVQGVIDCLFEEPQGWVLVDYKTDRIYGDAEHIAERYRLQLTLYARAISDIWSIGVSGAYLFFFDGCSTVNCSIEKGD